MAAKAKLNNEELAAAIASMNGNISAVAKKFSVARQSVLERVEKSATLKTVLKDSREGMIDNAESALYRAVLNGEAWAVCFFLKTQAKPRGYVERQELTGADGGDVQLAIREVIVEREDRPEDNPAAPDPA